jgi:hypothetical protein
MKRSLSFLAVLVAAVMLTSAARAESDSERLGRELAPLWNCISGEQIGVDLSVRAEVPVGGQKQTIEGRLRRYDDQAFDLELKHPEYAVTIQRRSDATALVLPLHKVAFVGRGEVDANDHLAPDGIIERTFTSGTAMSRYALLAGQTDPEPVAALLTTLARVTYDADTDRWSAGGGSFKFSDGGRTLAVAMGEVNVELKLGDAPKSAGELSDFAGMKIVELPRVELERQLSRGARRALEVLAPSNLLVAPAERARKVEHGELRWVGGQRVVLLSGTPEQIGQAHGELLKVEADRCIDSVLYAFGTAQTVRTGRWFRHDVEEAYVRLAPHIPEDHKRETRALAAALAHDERLIEVINVFPELFHCSGFAAFGNATADGKLYHGRVLDYMTTIGLQDSATTFIVAVDGKIPFANVGYAGFIGSVSGMNAKAISLGEMGGRGEGKWDGVPMATLMRRALEECSTLDDVMNLWKNSPRTCEYYYVFADGKTNRAVGVAAVPESVEFIHPGQSHERLGPGIEDVVVLSAGNRLECLRERVTEKHGKIDAEIGQWLMSRPVAMESNLHNVLFVPEDGVLYVANADHKRPAADLPYVRLDLRELLRSMK